MKPWHTDCMATSHTGRRALAIAIEIVGGLVVPICVLLLFSDDEELGPAIAFGVAIGSSAATALASCFLRRRVSIRALLSLFAILASAGFVLFQWSQEWFAWKEAALPTASGMLLAVLHILDRSPVTFLLKRVVNERAIETAIASPVDRIAVRRARGRVSWAIILAMFVSAAVNFSLAKLMVTARPGTAEFNQQVASFNAVDGPVVFGTAGLMIIGATLHYVIAARRTTGIPLATLVRSHEGRDGR